MSSVKDPIALKGIRKAYEELAAGIEEKDYDIVHPSIDKVVLKDQDITHWIVSFHGLKQEKVAGKMPGTPLYPGKYGIEVMFSSEFPHKAPDLKMLGGFEHFHVYQNGKICHTMITSWCLKYKVYELLSEICRMLHSPPKADDAANDQIKALVDPLSKSDDKLNKYYAYMQAQSKRFSTRTYE